MKSNVLIFICFIDTTLIIFHLTDFTLMDSFSKKPLPKLPVPDLSQSLEKYLRCIMPIVSEEDYKKTEAAVRDFAKQGGVGEQLQQILLKRAEETDNWVRDSVFK